MQENDFCRCEKVESVYTTTDDWYQYDRCNKCNKVLEDGIRPIDQDDII